MNAFKITHATADEQQPIRDLIREVKINPLGLKWQNFVVVKDENGRLIACGQLKPHRDGSVELASIAVKRPYRKHGLARLVIESLLADQPRPIWLTCVEKLTPFYKKFGFINVTSPHQMPSYFRFVYRLFKLYQWIARAENGLAVMVKPKE